jgi:ribosomal protein S30
MTKFKKMTGSLIFIVFALAGFTFAADSVTSEEAGEDKIVGRSESNEVPVLPSLGQFDSDVAQCRRQMRKYCAIAQQMMEKPDENKDQQQAEALEYLKDARNQWAVIQAKYQDNRPPEYANDSKFKVRLADINNAMQEMENHLAAGQAKQSFLSCGFGCGLFVQMHEENGLIYVLDRIFHLRKVAKTAITAGKNKGLSGVSVLLPDLLYHRNQIILAPCPWPQDTEKCKLYQDALKKLSSELDDLALCVQKGEKNKMMDVLKELMGTVNEAYGAVL